MSSAEIPDDVTQTDAPETGAPTRVATGAPTTRRGAAAHVNAGAAVGLGATPAPSSRPDSAPAPVDFAVLAAKYRPVFARIAEGSVERELERILPAEQIGWLKASGFTAVRVPVLAGGDGASLPQLFRLLVELAAADSHVAQAIRGHLGFVEDRLYAPESVDRDEWLARFAAGQLVGNAVTEIGAVALGVTNTRLDAAPDGFTITGSKFYTTGSIFAEWIDATAVSPDGVEVAALVSTAPDSTASGSVEISDNWTGFGQRLTGSGTTVFTAAPVQAAHVYDFSERFPYQTALYQLSLVAVLAGIARAAERDAADQVANRSRAFSHGNSPITREDPQILDIVGRISADAFAAEAVTERAAQSLQRAFDARDSSAGVRDRAKRETEIETAQAQIVVSQLTLGVTTRLFDGLGASATSTSSSLDRHWRNARTVTSHNPVAFKARIVGDYLVNDAEPPYEWYVGVGAKPAAAPK
ncbi:acyl-CoA dehydrogenase family protein [Leifsonia kafniensis]|uniref:Acyl-CoA dehydrogenase family protein n=1 Tax=Leifsonia kafniensis TaxID=475957 RepID=A0ABP7KI57_9MICO